MRFDFGRFARFALALGVVCVGVSAFGQQYKPEQILKQKPTQDVVVDYPTAEETPNCAVKPFKEGTYQGVCLYKPDGTTPLRVWCAPPAKEGARATVEQIRFYRDGQEVYRDVLGKEARWLNAGGSRRGTVSKGKLVAWTSISPEEATAEIVAALANGDFERFQRVALTAADVKALGLTGALANEVGAQIDAVSADAFAKLAQTLQLPADARWGAFNGATPATIPAGKDGLSQDLTLYFNANVVVLKGDDASQSQQLYVGDLVKVGDAWKIVGLPTGETFGKATGEVSAASVFFPAGSAPGAAAETSGEMSAMGSELTDAYQKLDAASAAEYPALFEKTFGLLLELADKNPQEQTNFASQAADLAFSGAQSGKYPDGAKKLAELAETYKDSNDAELKAHIRYRQIVGDYYAVVQAVPQPKPAELTKAQEKYAEDLAAFVDEYANTEAGADATMGLALDQEYMLDADAASSYYSQVAQNFGDSPIGKKASGALARLRSEGGALTLPALKYVDGTPCALPKAGGKPVAVFFWASWEPESVAAMKQLAAGGKLDVIGINVDGCPNPDASAAEQAAFYKPLLEGLPWKNVCEPAGLEGTAATALGVQNAPWIVLIGKDGKVVRSNITGVDDLEGILKELK